MGQCNYYLVKHENFTIEAENVACAGAISQVNFAVVSFIFDNYLILRFVGNELSD